MPMREIPMVRADLFRTDRGCEGSSGVSKQSSEPTSLFPSMLPYTNASTAVVALVAAGMHHEDASGTILAVAFNIRRIDFRNR
jgi:hypothetical protein